VIRAQPNPGGLTSMALEIPVLTRNIIWGYYDKGFCTYVWKSVKFATCVSDVIAQFEATAGYDWARQIFGNKEKHERYSPVHRHFLFNIQNR
jgi:hypothetical protein